MKIISQVKVLQTKYLELIKMEYISKCDIKEEVPNYKTKEELGRMQAEIDYNKDYPKTVEKNI